MTDSFGFNGAERYANRIEPVKEELAGASNRRSANDEVKQYLTNQKTESGEKLELPQELLDIASQAEKDGVENELSDSESDEQKEE